jgi:hypothetical protein
MSQSSGSVREALMMLLQALTRQSLLKSIPLLALTGVGIHRLYRIVSAHLRRLQHKDDWDAHVDFGQIQVCILSTEHLTELGRVEKRTLQVKDLDTLFGNNTYVVEKLMAAAQRSIVDNNPILTRYLDNCDKWHILNACTNMISSLFAPYHVFFNEARRYPSNYKSAWYCFTLTCTRTASQGRYFITPFRPAVGDIGALRIRIVLVNEQELRDICAGEIAPPVWGFFNDRHRERWSSLKSFSELFENQLRKLTNYGIDKNLTRGKLPDWGPNLCGRIGANKNKPHNPSQQAMEAMKQGLQSRIAPEDNCFLRIHIPFPGSGGEKETRSKDVVLFE